MSPDGHPWPADEAAAYALLEALRWGGAPGSCPHCGTPGRSYYLRPAGGGSTRRTRGGGQSPRRIWKCATCRRQFSVLTGTVLQGTKIGLRIWVRVLSAAADDPAAVLDAAQVAASYGLTGEAARLVVRRVRAALDALSAPGERRCRA